MFIVLILQAYKWLPPFAADVYINNNRFYTVVYTVVYVCKRAADCSNWLLLSYYYQRDQALVTVFDYQSAPTEQKLYWISSHPHSKLKTFLLHKSFPL